MFRDKEEIRKKIIAIIEKFHEKGATSPEKALTIQELGLPPRFEEAMHRRLGQTGIFVEVNGKYYLNEDRLKQIQEQRQRSNSENDGGDRWSRAQQSSRPQSAGFLLMLPIGLIIGVFLFYFLFISGVGLFPGEFLILLTIILVSVAIVRMLFWRSRMRIKL
jgi:hypothetical protein